MPNPRTCLFITETGDEDFAVFAYIYAHSDLTYLEILAHINDLLHRHHDKVYYYPDITQETAKSIVKTYAQDYPQYTVTIQKGLIK